MIIFIGDNFNTLILISMITDIFEKRKNDVCKRIISLLSVCGMGEALNI